MNIIKKLKEEIFSIPSLICLIVYPVICALTSPAS